jgi:nicotinamide-nucleotide amidase
MKVGVLLTGSELLDGRVADTNARWIGQKLSEEGITIHEVIICGDQQEHIVSALQRLAGSVETIIVSGGLGPTTDDCTREAVAEFLQVPLYMDEQVLGRLKALYAERKRTFHDNSAKQASRPQGALLIENDWGTASCFEVEKNIGGRELTIISLPGVPSELTNLCIHKVFPKMFSKINKRYSTVSYSTYGMPEASVGAVVESLHLPSTVEVAYRAATPEIHLKLRGYDAQEVGEAALKVKGALGDVIFSEVPDEFLPECVGRICRKKNKKVFVIETFTGGKLCEALQRGAKEFFLGGIVAPDGVARSTPSIEADIVLSLSLDVPGEKGSTIGISLSISGKDTKHSVPLTGGIERVKSFAVHAALDQLRHFLSPLDNGMEGYGREVDPPR